MTGQQLSVAACSSPDLVSLFPHPAWDLCLLRDAANGGAQGGCPGIPSLCCAELAAASHAFAVFNSAAMIFGFSSFFFFFSSDKSVISPLPYQTHRSDLPLQKVNDKEFYSALEIGNV